MKITRSVTKSSNVKGTSIADEVFRFGLTSKRGEGEVDRRQNKISHHLKQLFEPPLDLSTFFQRIEQLLAVLGINGFADYTSQTRLLDRFTPAKDSEN